MPLLDPPRRDALYIHLGNRQQHGPLRAQPSNGCAYLATIPRTMAPEETHTICNIMVWIYVANLHQQKAYPYAILPINQL